MQPESSDGLASVGTILPKEGAALLPGGSFRSYGVLFLPLWQARKGSMIDTESALSSPLCRRSIPAGEVDESQPSVTRNCLLDTFFFAAGMSPCESRVVDALSRRIDTPRGIAAPSSGQAFF